MKIEKSKINREIKRLEKILANYKNMNQEIQNKLIKDGYVYEELGTGKTTKISSKQIKILKPYGEDRALLAVGICNKSVGKYQISRAYVKTIIE